MSDNVDILLWIVFNVSLTALVSSLLIYPLLMVLASRRRRTRTHITDWPIVSLIIPAYNESLLIDAKIENCFTIDYPPGQLEVIVASDGSDDGTVSITRTHESRGVKVMDLHPRRGKASVLNDAVAASSGEILCLCDANVMFRPDAVRRMVAHLADPSIGAVTGDVRLKSEDSDFGEGESLYYRIERAMQLGESRVGSLVCVDGGMYVMRRELFQELPKDTILDDFANTINVIRRGRRVVYEPLALADENGTPCWRDEYRRRVRTTRGAVQSVKRRLWPPMTQPIVFVQYLFHKLLRWLGPVWLGALLISSSVLWHSGVLMQSLVISQAAFYGLAVLAAVSRPLRQTPVGGIPFYFTMSQVAMAEGICRGLFARPTGIWERTMRTVPGIEGEVAAIHGAAVREDSAPAGAPSAGVLTEQGGRRRVEAFERIR